MVCNTYILSTVYFLCRKLHICLIKMFTSLTIPLTFNRQAPIISAIVTVGDGTRRSTSFVSIWSRLKAEKHLHVILRSEVRSKYLQNLSSVCVIAFSRKHLINTGNLYSPHLYKRRSRFP